MVVPGDAGTGVGRRPHSSATPTRGLLVHTGRSARDVSCRGSRGKTGQPATRGRSATGDELRSSASGADGLFCDNPDLAVTIRDELTEIRGG